MPHVFQRNGKSIRSISGAWRTACKLAGLEGWIFHDLRRTAVRNMERAGVSRSVAMKLSGHKTMSVYSRYAIADAGALKAGVEKLARLHTAEPRKVVPIQEARRDLKVIRLSAIESGIVRRRSSLVHPTLTDLALGAGRPESLRRGSPCRSMSWRQLG